MVGVVASTLSMKRVEDCPRYGTYLCCRTRHDTRVARKLKILPLIDANGSPLDVQAYTPSGTVLVQSPDRLHGVNPPCWSTQLHDCHEHDALLYYRLSPASQRDVARIHHGYVETALAADCPFREE